MDRRAFIGGLALGYLAGPVVAEAHPPVGVHRIGVLLHDGAPPGLLEAFRAELQELGYLEGKNVAIEIRDAAGNNARLNALAEEVVRLNVDLILAVNTPAAQAAKKATATIPVVITRVTDPVRSGLVASLARPGGNVTGLSFNNSEMAIKGLQVLREALPGISRVGILSNAGNPGHLPQVAAMESAGPQLRLEVLGLRVRVPGDLPEAFRSATRTRAEALFILDDTAITKHRGQIVKLAATHSLPLISRYKDFADAGGLIAYGPSLPAVYRRAAHYAARILKGTKPSDLPLEEPSQFDLVVNLKTAKMLALTIPPSVLVQATAIIE
jgi:putative ABC transport system substrate-binding protein